jgi:hypothetical protein
VDNPTAFLAKVRAETLEQVSARLRVAARGCAWLRVAARGCVWLRVAARGCVRAWLRVQV